MYAIYYGLNGVVRIGFIVVIVNVREEKSPLGSRTHIRSSSLGLLIVELVDLRVEFQTIGSVPTQKLFSVKLYGRVICLEHNLENQMAL